MFRRAHRGLECVQRFGVLADAFERHTLIVRDFAVGCISRMSGGERGLGVRESLQAAENAAVRFL